MFRSLSQKPVKRNEMQRGFKRIVKEDLADPEIDAILDKILAQGMDSLTAKEKEMLSCVNVQNAIHVR